MATVSGRAPILSLLAISLILASVVNLAFLFVATSQPRVIRTASSEPTLLDQTFSGTSAGVPHPKVSIEKALATGDVASVKQHMHWCRKNGTCDLERNLEKAIAANDPAGARVLIAAGANVNARGIGRDGGTPLHEAAVQGRVNVAKVLLSAGADVNARDADGVTPLHKAAAWGHVELARMLLAAGADANAGDRQRQTPLHIVASRSVPPLAVYADVTRVLLAAGARPNLRADDGSTPLRRAELAASRLTLDGNMKAAGDANEVLTLLRGSRGYH